ncbi:PTS sugar transporter subunit IIA [candidate division WOR-3 bacterium]|nr:PTS sugar transporter subunit IIA [candidate division WOR-3 bacterium]
MLFIHKMLNENLIDAEVKSITKNDVLNEMADILVKNNFIKDRTQLINKLIERESIETTGIGHSVAIPHARTESVDGLAMAFGLSKSGIDFKSLDGKPVNIIFLIASNEENKNNYIKLLARISRICRKDSFRNKIINAANAKEIVQIFEEEECI